MYIVIYTSHTIEVRRTSELARWLKRLKDSNARARINLHIRRISLTGNLGDYKSVGDGICELRIDYGPGYRLCFAWRGREIVLLLIGGNKPSQQRDIRKAQEFNEQYE
ncbi:type II toxin-antitoxin system RelE/ParE family toxin [Olsenella profusa]|uniref:type II toxin-antitoxin system RelE/ParE family toxin n=1 Tax=Olsenella profusa TaxID=138595 RepID=UPI00058C3D0B